MLWLKIPKCISQCELFFLLVENILTLWSVVHSFIVGLLLGKNGWNALLYLFFEIHFPLTFYNSFVKVFATQGHRVFFIILKSQVSSLKSHVSRLTSFLIKPIRAVPTATFTAITTF